MKMMKKISVAFIGAFMALGVGVSIGSGSAKEAKATATTEFITSPTNVGYTSGTQNDLTLEKDTITLTFSSINNKDGDRIQMPKLASITSTDVGYAITSVTVGGYGHTSSTYNDGSFSVQGSTDGTSFTEVDSFTGLEQNPSSPIVSTFDESDNYHYFKIINGNDRPMRVESISVEYAGTAAVKTVSGVTFSLNDGVGDFFAGETIATNQIKAVVSYINPTSTATITDGTGLTINSGAVLANEGSNAVNITYSDTYGSATADLTVTGVRAAKVLLKYYIDGTLTTASYKAGDAWDYDGLSLYASYKSGEDTLDPELIGTVDDLIAATTLDITPSPATALFGTKKLVLNGEYNSVAIETKTINVTVVDAVRFIKCTDSTLTDGDYVLSVSEHVMNNTVSGDGGRKLGVATVDDDYEISSDKNTITDPKDAVIFKITDAGSSQYTIQDANDKYVYHNGGKDGTNNYLALTTTLNDAAKWTVSAGSEAGTYHFVNVAHTTYKIAFNAGNTSFACYPPASSVSRDFVIYKKVMTQVSLSSDNTELGLGDVATVTATRINGGQDLSDDIEFAKVDPDNLVTLGTPVGDTVKVTVNEGILTSGTVTINATLNGTTDSILLNIYNVKALRSIAVTTEPKTAYKVGDAVDLTGMVITATYSDNSTATVSPKTELNPDGYVTNVDSIDVDTKGEKTLTISYTLDFASDTITRSVNLTLTYGYEKVNVTQGIAKIEALGTEAKEAGTATEMVELTGIVCSTSNGVFVADRYNETEKTKMIKLYGLDSAVSKVLKVNSTIVVDSVLKYWKSDDIYETYSPVVVSYDAEPEEVIYQIRVDTDYMGNTTKKDYSITEKDKPVDLTGVRVFLDYSGTTKSTSISYDNDKELFLGTFDVTGPDFNEEMIRHSGNKVTITHKTLGYQTSYSVTVYEAYPSKISVEAKTGKTTYASGEVFDSTGYVTTITFFGGTTQELTIADESLTFSTGHEGNKLYEGDTHVTFIYSYVNYYGQDRTLTFDFYGITVAEKYVTSITANFIDDQPEDYKQYHDNVYDYGETIADYFKYEIRVFVNYNDGTSDKYVSKGGSDPFTGIFTFSYPSTNSYGEKAVKITHIESNLYVDVPVFVRGIETLELKEGTYVRPEYRTDDSKELHAEIHDYIFVATYSDGSMVEMKNKNDTEWSDWEGFEIVGDDITVGNDGPEHVITFSYKGAECSIKIDVKLCDNDFNALVTSGMAELNGMVKEEDYNEENWIKVQKIISDTQTRLASDEFDNRGENYYSANVHVVFDEAKAEINKIAKRGLESITLSGTYKTSYNTGDELDLTGLVVTANYDDSSSKVLTSDKYSVSEVDMSTAGNKTVTISYGGKSVSFTITVTQGDTPVVVTLTGIAVTTAPTKTVYDVGETFNDSGLVVTATYSDGSSKAVTDYELSGFSSAETGIKVITVTYQDKTAEFSVIIKEAGETAEVAQTRVDAVNEYLEYFDSIDLTGYSEAEIAAFNAAKEAAMQALKDAKSVDEINTALANAKAALQRLIDAHNTPARQNNVVVIALVIAIPSLFVVGLVLFLILRKKKTVKAK